MEMSESINEIAKALSAAQGELKNAVCDTKAHGYNYAKLVQYVDIAKPVLPKHELSVVQFVESNEDGKVKVVTLLAHSSGQWFKASAVAPDAVLMGGAGKNPVQVAGSQITYMRRYQFAAMLGMTDNAEDSDAQGLVSPPKNAKPAMQKPQLRQVTKSYFKENVDRWAKDAIAIGPNGIAKVQADERAKGWEFSESAINALQDSVIELAKQEKEQMQHG